MKIPRCLQRGASLAPKFEGRALRIVRDVSKTDAYFREDLATLTTLARIGANVKEKDHVLIPESQPPLGPISPAALAHAIRGLIILVRGEGGEWEEDRALANRPLTSETSIRSELGAAAIASRVRWAASDARAIYRCMRDGLFAMESPDYPWSTQHRGEEGGLRDDLEGLASRLGPLADIADLFEFNTEQGEPAPNGVVMVYRGDGSQSVNDLVGHVTSAEASLRIAARYLSFGGRSSFEPDQDVVDMAFMRPS